MKFLADENYPPTLIVYLQKNFHDVKRIQRSARGISDDSVVIKAQKENRILITFDKDLLKYSEAKIIVFDFHKNKVEDILLLMNKFLKALATFNKKKSFTLIFSEKGFV